MAKNSAKYDCSWNHTCQQDLRGGCIVKLSKDELEDQYFRLVQENTELKKSTNELKENVKLLNTKLLRLSSNSSQHSVFCRKDCCVKSQEVVRLYKKEIEDLQLSKKQLQEKMKLMSIQLCSKKQYLRPFASSMSLKTVKSESQLNARKVKKDLEKERNKIARKVFSAREEIKVFHSLQEKEEPELEENNESAVEINKQEEQETKLDDEVVAQDSGEIDELKHRHSSLEQELLEVKQKHQDEIAQLLERIRTLEEQIRSLGKQKEFAAQSTREVYIKRLEECENRNKQLHEQLVDAFIKQESLLSELTMTRGQLDELRIQLHSAEMNTNAVNLLEEHIKKMNLVRVEQASNDNQKQVLELFHRETLNNMKLMYDSELQVLRDLNQNLTLKVGLLQAEIEEINNRAVTKKVSPFDSQPLESNQSLDHEQIAPIEETKDKIIIPSKYKTLHVKTALQTDLISEEGDKEAERESNVAESELEEKTEITPINLNQRTDVSDGHRTHSIRNHEQNENDNATEKIRASDGFVGDQCSGKYLRKFKIVDVFRGKFKANERHIGTKSLLPELKQKNIPVKRYDRPSTEAVTSSDTELDVSSLPEEAGYKRERDREVHDMSESSCSYADSDYQGHSEALMLSEGEIPRCHFRRNGTPTRQPFRAEEIPESLLQVDDMPPKVAKAVKAVNDEVMKCRQLIENNPVFDTKLKM